jgi:hypothetical protein
MARGQYNTNSKTRLITRRTNDLLISDLLLKSYTKWPNDSLQYTDELYALCIVIELVTFHAYRHQATPDYE